MRVIFLEDVPGSAQAGEVKEVKNGYARNFLIPHKLATPATHDQLQRIEIIRKAGEERRIKEEQDLTALAEHLSQLSVALTAKMGPTGRFYGAVTSAHIAEELARLTEREIDRRTVLLPKPIHEPGEYQVELRFAQGITTTIPVAVTAEGAEASEAVLEAEVPVTAEGAEAPEAVQPTAEQQDASEEEQEEPKES